jgi:hypothetical protein
MRVFCCTLGLMIASLIVVPLLATAGDDKADKKDDPKAAKKDVAAKKGDKKDKDEDPADPKKGEVKKEKLVWGSEFAGKVKEMSQNSQRDLTIEIQIQVPNIDGQRDWANHKASWARRQAEIFRDPNPVNRANALADLQRQIAQYKPNIVKNIPKDVPIRATEDCKVRSLFPPLEYDDKGNLKKWTAKDLAEMRKDGLPGYPADFETLQAGQIVKVYLKKQAAPQPAPKGGKAPNIKLDDDPNLGQTPRAEAVMLLIMQNPPPRQ